MSKCHINIINKELKRWLVASQKLRRSASICYGKIKSSIATLEPLATKAEMDKLQDDAGKFLKLIFLILFIFELIIFPIFDLYFIEAVLDKIGKNANYCLETLTVDVENLESKDDFVQMPKRKRKSADDPCKTPSKKRKLSKKHILEVARDEEKAGQSTSQLGKLFINDQAEGKKNFLICRLSIFLLNLTQFY